MMGTMKGSGVLVIFAVFVALVTYVAVVPALNEVIAGAEGEIDGTAYLIIRMLPFVLALSILAMPLIYGGM